jgi:hypothetical protein
VCTRPGSRHLSGLLALLGLLVLSLPARAQLAYDVSVNTTGLNGTAGLLAFDLTDGDGVANNTALVSAFATDGTLAPGGNTDIGGATGDLPGDLTIADSSFFNESARGITLGNSLFFRLLLTNHFAGGAPDEFAFFLLDSTGTTSLVQTSDPTGANALFTVDLTGAPGGILSVFSSPEIGYSVTPVAPAPIPEPGVLTALGIGCAMVWPLLRRRTR